MLDQLMPQFDLLFFSKYIKGKFLQIVKKAFLDVKHSIKIRWSNTVFHTLMRNKCISVSKIKDWKPKYAKIIISKKYTKLNYVY